MLITNLSIYMYLERNQLSRKEFLFEALYQLLYQFGSTMNDDASMYDMQGLNYHVSTLSMYSCI